VHGSGHVRQLHVMAAAFMNVSCKLCGGTKDRRALRTDSRNSSKIMEGLNHLANAVAIGGHRVMPFN
jgi:hypothetical protein